MALEAFTAALPELLGGSADLTGSNLTNTKCTPACASAGDVASARPMAAAATSTTACASSAWRRIMNGVALHGGFIPYGGTFLTFSDYSRNAIRMAALMKQRVVHRVHPRLHRPGRRRPHPPVDRARRLACA
jgi:transketolase